MATKINPKFGKLVTQDVKNKLLNFLRKGAKKALEKEAVKAAKDLQRGEPDSTITTTPVELTLTHANEGYVICLVVVTALLRKSGVPEAAQRIYRQMQEELAQSFKTGFPIECSDKLVFDLFSTLENLASALEPILQIAISKGDCARALQMLAHANLKTSTDSTRILRPEGYVRYFCDILTVHKRIGDA